MAQIGRIVVVGGGIGGLSTAIALDKAGFQVDVFEQSPALREGGAGVGLWSNAMASLDQLGVGAELRRDRLPLRVVAGANPRGTTLSWLALDDWGPEFADAACFIVLRPTLLAALARRVPAARVHTDRRIERIEPGDAAVTLHCSDGRSERADLVIGADGLHSVARPHVVGVSALRYSGQTCFRGVARVAPSEPGVLREVQGRGQRGSVCPVSADTVYWWTAFNAPADRILPANERKAALLARYAEWPFGLPQAIAATPDDAILQNDLVDRAPVARYVAGRVALIGDAAHPTTPNLGQGANMAIDDAVALARALRDEPTPAAALARYERERLPRTRQIVQRSWSFGRLCRWQSPPAVALREAMLRMTPPSVMRNMLRWQILEGVGAL